MHYVNATVYRESASYLFEKATRSFHLSCKFRRINQDTKDVSMDVIRFPIKRLIYIRILARELYMRVWWNFLEKTKFFKNYYS